MVKEFGNSTDDSSEGSLYRCEDASPSSVLDRDAGDNGNDSIDPEEDLKEDPEEDTDGTETQSGV